MKEENLRKLKAAMVQADISVEQVASVLKVDRATVYRKLSGKTEFVLLEVVAIRNLLCLSVDEFDSIFLTKNLRKRKIQKRRKMYERSNQSQLQRQRCPERIGKRAARSS